LQALALLNDPTYVEAARKLGERALKECGPTPEARLAHAFRLATARAPAADETKVLLGVYRQALDRFRKDAAAAKKLLAVGESPRDPGFDDAELAAWATVASLILNLDETITKN
jgi:hypothetical protein